MVDAGGILLGTDVQSVHGPINFLQKYTTIGKRATAAVVFPPKKGIFVNH